MLARRERAFRADCFHQLAYGDHSDPHLHRVDQWGRIEGIPVGPGEPIDGPDALRP